MAKLRCDFCGQKKENVKGTHYGSGFGYVRLICNECKIELGAKLISEESKEIESPKVNHNLEELGLSDCLPEDY